MEVGELVGSHKEGKIGSSKFEIRNGHLLIDIFWVLVDDLECLVGGAREFVVDFDGEEFDREFVS